MPSEITAAEYRRRNHAPDQPPDVDLWIPDNEIIMKFDVVPMGKPRMNQGDRYPPFRDVVVRWHSYKDAVGWAARKARFALPDSGFLLIFFLPMPVSWSKTKKSRFRGRPHQQKPDKDNLEKALFDAMRMEDKAIWDSASVKLWSDAGSILVLRRPLLLAR